MTRLSTAEHAATKRQHQQQRNAAARERRASQPGRRAAVVLIDGTGSDGQTYRLAFTAKDRAKAYFLTRTPEGTLVCSCFTFSWRHTCAHSEAAQRRRTTDGGPAGAITSPGSPTLLTRTQGDSHP